MKKIDFNYGEIVYKEVLDNGLTVYLYPTNKSKNFYITVSTHFGAEVMSYKKNNKVYDVTKGSAHFLEHRVMDFTKNVDAMNYFSSLSKSQQQDVIKKTHQFNSMNEMQSYVDNIANGQTFN